VPAPAKRGFCIR
jgi:transcriptional regulator with XRE-family HTH domain